MVDYHEIDSQEEIKGELRVSLYEEHRSIELSQDKYQSKQQSNNKNIDYTLDSKKSINKKLKTKNINGKEEKNNSRQEKTISGNKNRTIIDEIEPQNINSSINLFKVIKNIDKISIIDFFSIAWIMATNGNLSIFYKDKSRSLILESSKNNIYSLKISKKNSSLQHRKHPKRNTRDSIFLASRFLLNSIAITIISPLVIISILREITNKIKDHPIYILFSFLASTIGIIVFLTSN